LRCTNTAISTDRRSCFPRTNLLVGPNGQGKTNLLEAIYFLGYGRSFRTSVPRECIQHGNKAARVEGTVHLSGLTESSKSYFHQPRKSYFSTTNRRPGSVCGEPACSCFHPGTHARGPGGPGERRAFLDRAMILLSPGHVRYMASYGRALKQRNALLTAIGEMDEALLESWEEALIQNGVRIITNRRRYIEQIKNYLPAGHFGNDQLKLHYLSNVVTSPSDLPEEIEIAFRRKLQSARDSDRKSGYTSIGPHRDEMKIYVNGKSLVDFGSAGQQRSGLLSLYFAQMEIHKEIHGFYPIFLMDDAEAELDEVRLRTFLSYLAERTQTFLTTAKESFSGLSSSSISSISGSIPDALRLLWKEHPDLQNGKRIDTDERS